MRDPIDAMVGAYEGGRMSRRQLVSGLAGLVAAAATGQVPGPARAAASTFKGVGLNHLALRVKDVPRSRDFYVRHLGLEVLRAGESRSFLGFGDNFLALFQGAAPAMDHYCYTVPDYDPDQAMDRLKSAGFTPRREENRVYFKDPDGLTVQLAGQWSAWPGPRPG